MSGSGRLEKELRDREIEREYRRAYGEGPQEAWLGEFGMRLVVAAVASERRSHHAYGSEGERTAPDAEE
jgi:hypothetical protein